MSRNWDIQTIVRQFQISGEFISARSHGSGHINDTFIVNFLQGGMEVPHIFQRINHNIFPNPPLMMENIVRVTQHIRQKLKARNVANISRHVLTVIFTHEGLSYYKDTNGNYWRAYIFIDRARSYDLLQSVDQAFQVARMFGHFQEMLHDFPGPPLHETIPDFHNGIKRMKDLHKALERDTHNRAKATKPEIDFILANASSFEILPDLVKKGELPVRAAHNDTKINNVMVDETTGEGVCVIDLDTVMPGLSLYDFGDLARTTLSPTDEDECDLSKISVEIPMFETILKGFLHHAGKILTQTELDYLIFSSKIMTLIIGLRFLTDYLSGDTYFKIHRESHNLDRCRTQFKLVQSIIEHEEEMNKILQRYLKSSNFY